MSAGLHDVVLERRSADTFFGSTNQSNLYIVSTRCIVLHDIHANQIFFVHLIKTSARCVNDRPLSTLM
jgi:hypothetical protein